MKQVRAILDDPEASANDKVVALEFLRNANIAAGGVLPMCQGYRHRHHHGQEGPAHLDRRLATRRRSRKAPATPTLKKNLRYSQLAPISMFEEKNTKNNMPAQVEIYAEGQENESAYKFLFIAKGGGSANKSYLYQGTPSILTRERMLAFLKEKILTLGTAACPPYHLAIAIGGTSAELCMKTVKLASVKYLDNLPTQGSEDAHAFRDLEMEAEIHKMTQQLGIGAQFGGKYFCHDVRVVRPAAPRRLIADRHRGVVLGRPPGDRQDYPKDGVFLEELEHDPARYMPEIDPHQHGGGKVVRIDLNRPMKDILATLTQHPIKTFCLLSGPMIVARDLAHAKLRERLESGQGLPDYVKNHPIYYAGPAKTPEGYASGAFGPTTAGRMDSYVGDFQAAGGSLVTVAKGNRSPQVRESLPETRRLLPRLHRRRRREPRRALHQEGRGARISRARHGSDLAHRSREFPGLHRRRRQGQRLLQGIEFGMRRPVILRACESLDFGTFRRETNQRLSSLENCKVRIDSQTLRRPAPAGPRRMDGRGRAAPAALRGLLRSRLRVAAFAEYEKKPARSPRAKVFPGTARA